MEKKTYNIILILLLLSFYAYAQEREYSMQELISLNQNSTEHAINVSDSLINRYNNKLFKIKILPKLSMSATLPNLTNNISSIALEDGSEKFVNRFYMSSSISFSASQFVPFTGGTLSFTSGLSRLDNFAPIKNMSYNLNMFHLDYSQSSYAFNSYKWEKKILMESNKLFSISTIQKTEQLNLDIVELFFDLLATQKEVELNASMISRAEHIYERAVFLYENKRISKVSLLDAKINLSKLKNSVVRLKKEKLQSSLYTKLYLDEYPTVRFDFDDFMNIKLDFNKDLIISRALEYGHNLSRNIEELREQTEIKKQKAAGLPTISLSIGGGINSKSEEFKRLPALPTKSISALFSVNIPILSWGENRTKVKVLEQSAKIHNLQHIKAIAEYTAEYNYELDNLDYIHESVLTDGETLEMLYTKLEQLLANFEYNAVDFSEVEATRVQIIQTELQRISKIKIFYMTIYKFRIYALYDILLKDELI